MYERIRVRDMKKIITALFVMFIVNVAHAACTTTTSYSCEAGYYLVGSNCYRCPSVGDQYPTTDDKNTGGITSCCFASGTTVEFENSIGSGTEVYQEKCCYSE